MAATASGTYTPAATATEYTVSTVSTEGVYVLTIDTANMALADELYLSIHTKVLTGGTTRKAYDVTYKHVQANPIKVSIPIKSEFELLFKLNQKAGTARAYPWRIDAI